MIRYEYKEGVIVMKIRVISNYSTPFATQHIINSPAYTLKALYADAIEAVRPISLVQIISDVNPSLIYTECFKDADCKLSFSGYLK